MLFVMLAACWMALRVLVLLGDGDLIILVRKMIEIRSVILSVSV